MARQKRVFYAYPYQPAGLGETINAAIKDLNSHWELKRDNIRLRPWTDNLISGKSVISTIARQIDRDHIFACDLTYPNVNVNYELGYAIARFKRIYCSLDPNISGATEQYKRVYSGMLNMGYNVHSNYKELTSAFIMERPWDSLNDTLLHARHRNALTRPEKPTLMYIKPPVETNSVIKIQEEFQNTIFGDAVIVDDPKENPSQILDWYAEKIRVADVVIVHMLSMEHAEHWRHNLKASIIAGLAHGFGRRMVMFAHAPYEPPVDYEQYLMVHETADVCTAMTHAWLKQIGDTMSHRRRRRPTSVAPSTTMSQDLDLRTLFLGDHIAEHEATELPDYFVETDTFLKAIDDRLTILVGRRGTGKSAILYAIESEMESSGQNHVTTLKPVGYETHGLIRVLDEIQERSERGFLIESLWKYLIYSEIAVSVVASIRNKPVFDQRSTDEEAFMLYYAQHREILDQPFSQRIDSAVSLLSGVGSIPDARQQRLRISEHLHTALIGDIRRHLGSVLNDLDSLALLIDGLDEPWAPGDHIELLAELIAGLLTVAQHIPRDFDRSSSRIKPVNTKMTVVLRSDIFAFIQQLIPEQDKLPILRVTWDDEEKLLSVLNERMLRQAPKGRDAETLWTTLFPDEVVGVSVDEFLFRTVLHRPRDVIHFMKVAVSHAINRRHEFVEPNDLLSAREQYSQYAFNSILKEDDPSKGKLEEVLYEFAGVDRVVDKSEIELRFQEAGVERQNMEFYLDLLCDISFLGVETSNGFKYVIDEEQRRTLRRVANVLASRAGRREKFEINPAFYQVLQIE